MCLCRIMVMSAVRLIAFWKKGVLPRDMGKEVLEGTNSLGSEKHISYALPGSFQIPTDPAVLLWAGAKWAGLPRGCKQRPRGSGVTC